jgi:recA bacterial DNA recombination protein
MSFFPLSTGHSQFLPAGFEDKKAAVLRHIAASERLIAVRPASRLEMRPRPEMLSTGIPEVDAITGGLPRGCLTEICGPASSGKTSLLMATIAAATRRGETCVLIDASDSFDPASGAAAGVDFSKFLWIRCGGSPVASVVRTFNHRGHRGTQRTTEDKSSERKLEQVLKTTDLILQSGGFGLVVLDLAGIPENFARRIPLASWFRFQRVIEPAKTALLVVSESPRTQSCAALVIKLSATRGCPILVSPLFGETRWGFSHQSAKPTHIQVLEGMRLQAEVVRSRLERRPAQSVTAAFKTQAVRAG